MCIMFNCTRDRCMHKEKFCQRDFDNDVVLFFSTTVRMIMSLHTPIMMMMTMISSMTRLSQTTVIRPIGLGDPSPLCARLSMTLRFVLISHLS